MPKTEICSMDIIEKMCMISSAIEREVSVAIDRKGNVKSVAVGDSTSVELPLLDITAFTEAINNIKKQILDRVGLSYSVFGLGNSGAGEAAEALMIRQENSYKTREEKLMLWKPFLRDVCRLSLIYFDVLNNTPEIVEGKMVFIVNNSYDFDCIIRFAPYRVQTDKERAEDLKAIMDTGLMSKEDAIREYYKDQLSEEEIENKIQELKEDKPQPVINETIQEEDNKQTSNEDDNKR